MNRKQVIAERLNSIKSQISKNVRLVAVSKYTDLEDIEYARQSGQQEFGENRVDELIAKAQHFHLHNLRWHFIGKIQTNKINRLLKTPGLTHLHSVDSSKTLMELYKRETHLSSSGISFFLQVNTSGETQKQGFSNKHDIYQTIKMCIENKQSKLKLIGLMTMAPLGKDARPYFRQLSLLRQNISHDFGLNNLHLSMGMGADYLVALEEGASFVRIGRLIFNRENT